MNLILFAVVAACACFVNGQTKSCTTPSGGSGERISVYNCKELLDLANKKNRTRQEITLLQKSLCVSEGTIPIYMYCRSKYDGVSLWKGFQDCIASTHQDDCTRLFQVIVCCPKKQPEGNCFTPEGELGQCISLHSCAHLKNMLQPPPASSESIAYVLRSKCEGTEQYSVCCGPPPHRNTDNPVTPSGNCNSHMTALPPDPRTECCGVDGRVGNKIVGGNETTVDQYPWLVIIEYVKGGKTKLLCGGVLISGKYVMTAAHCVAGHVLSIGTPMRVRLGEYDTSKEGEDCAPVEAGGEDCTEGVTRILIEKVIPHPEYNPVSPLKRNDIALLRLKETAPFTDFIRPICLPSKDLTAPQNRPANFLLYAAGWGAVSDKQSYSNVKLHVDLPYVSTEECQSIYSTYSGRNIPLWKAQMCAGGVTGKDSCRGDSGGPLMYENGRTYEVTGIVSFGPIPCGMEGVPGVYSKVYEYLDWIRTTIVP